MWKSKCVTDGAELETERMQGYTQGEIETSRCKEGERARVRGIERKRDGKRWTAEIEKYRTCLVTKI